MIRTFAAAVLSLTALSAACRSPSRSDSLDATVRPITVYEVDRRPMSPDSQTTIKLHALSEAAREIADSARKLPESMERILELRRETVHISPQPWWTTDGWGRPFLFSLDADRKTLLLLSRGADGEVGGGDDSFDVVRLRP